MTNLPPSSTCHPLSAATEARINIPFSSRLNISTGMYRYLSLFVMICKREVKKVNYTLIAFLIVIYTSKLTGQE